MERVKRARDLQARFVRDWKSARDHRADIVFGPEMLGTMEMEARSGKYNSLLRKLYMEGLDNILENAKGNPLDIYATLYREYLLGSKKPSAVLRQILQFYAHPVGSEDDDTPTVMSSEQEWAVK